MNIKTTVNIITAISKVVGEIIENIKLVDRVYQIIDNESILSKQSGKDFDVEGTLATIQKELDLTLSIDTITALKLDKNEGRLNLCFELVAKEIKQWTSFPIDLVKPLIEFVIKFAKKK